MSELYEKDALHAHYCTSVMQVQYKCDLCALQVCDASAVQGWDSAWRGLDKGIIGIRQVKYMKRQVHYKGEASALQELDKGMTLRDSLVHGNYYTALESFHKIQNKHAVTFQYVGPVL